MKRETFERLNQISEYLEISKDKFKEILLLCLNYQKESNEYINEDLLYEIIIETMNNMDYQNNSNNIYLYDMEQSKNVLEAFNRALSVLGYQKVKRMR